MGRLTTFDSNLASVQGQSEIVVECKEHVRWDRLDLSMRRVKIIYWNMLNSLLQTFTVVILADHDCVHNLCLQTLPFLSH